jgi:uncharacterized protein
MEKVLIISDTHNNSNILKSVLGIENDCSIIFHLGDYYEDLDKCMDYVSGKTIVRVPGTFHKGYRDGSVSAVKIYSVFNWKFLLVHDVNIVSRKIQDVDIIFHGHTHQAELQKNNGRYFFNPGHLKQKYDRGSEASYAILEIYEDRLKFIVKNLKNHVIFMKIIKKTLEE